MGGSMSFLAAETIKLIQDTLSYLHDEHPSFILASQEDADYFRKNSEFRMLNAEIKADPTPVFAKTSAPSPETPKPQAAVPAQTAEFRMLNAEIKADPTPVFAKTSAPTPENPKLHAAVPTQTIESTHSKAREPYSFRIQNSEFNISSEFRQVFVRVFPQFPLIDEIPSDAIAVKIANRWKTKNKTAPISILVLHEPPEQKALLEQVAVALDVSFGSARVIAAEPIEKEKQWEAFLSVSDLKCIVVCDYTLWQLNGLMAHYKENPTQGSRALGSVPLFLLPDLSLYLKDPQLKRSLWKALCQKLSS